MKVEGSEPAARHSAEPTAELRSTTAGLAVLALVVVGGILRLLVAAQDLFADELSTYWIVTTRDLTGVVETVSTTAEITPPVSFVLSWVTSQLGHGRELVRLPSLIAGVASIPLVYAIGIRTVGRSAALLAAALTTLSPFMIYYSAEARGYGVLMALVLLSTLALLVAIERGQGRWWAVYAGAVCLAAYTHYTAIFVLAAQFAWACWVHPRTRRPLVVATSVAVLLYLPWLPSLKGDMDSPTTTILTALSPLSVETVGLTLGHWTIGLPTASVGLPPPFATTGSSLLDLPGSPALLLLTASACVGIYGIVTTRRCLGPRYAVHDWRIVLVALLAVATPVGTILQSVVGANIFRTRSLAPSWPYLALAVAVLLTLGGRRTRLIAAMLAVAAFGIGAVTMAGDDFSRPDHTRLSRFAGDQRGGVIVDASSTAPAPITNLDVEGSTPDVPVFRLGIPEQRTTPPFELESGMASPAEVAERATEAADGGPITVIAVGPRLTTVEEFVEHLPPSYALTHRELVPNPYFSLQALVYERVAAA